MKNIQLQICVNQDCNLDRLIETQENFHSHYLLGHEVLLEKNFIQIIEVLQKQRQNNFINYSQQKLIQLLSDYEKLYNNNIKIFIDEIFELLRRDIQSNNKEDQTEINLQEQILSKQSLNILVDMFNGNQNIVQKNNMQFDQELQQYENKLQQLDNEFQAIFKSYLDSFINIQKTTFDYINSHTDQFNINQIQKQIFSINPYTPILEVNQGIDGSNQLNMKNISGANDSQFQFQQYQQQQQQQQQQYDYKQESYHDYYNEYYDDYNDGFEKQDINYQKYEEQQEEIYIKEYEKQQQQPDINLFENYSDEESQIKKQQLLKEYNSKVNEQQQNISYSQTSSEESEPQNASQPKQIVKNISWSVIKNQKSKIEPQSQYEKKLTSSKQQPIKNYSSNSQKLYSNAYVDYDLSDRDVYVNKNSITSVKYLLKIILTTNKNVLDTQRLLYFKIKLLNQNQKMMIGMINLGKSNKKGDQEYLLNENGKFFKRDKVISSYYLNLLKYKTFELGISKQNKIEFICDEDILVAFPIPNYQKYVDDYQFVIYIKNIELTIL